MDTGFKALPFQTDNADVDLINYITEHGFLFFVKYWKKVAGDKTGSNFDRKYFTSYLRMYVFDTNSIFNSNMEEDWNGNKWNNIIDIISREPPNTLYGVIGFLSGEEQLSFIDQFLDTTILSIDRTTVNNLFLDRNTVKLIAKSSKLRNIIMFYADRKEINDILFCIIGVKNSRDNLYKTLDGIFADYIHTNAPHTLSAREFRDIGVIKGKLLGIAMALIEIYNGGNTPQKVAGFRLLTESTTNATPLNNMFWFIHSFLTISYHSISKYEKIISEFIETLEDKILELEQSTDPNTVLVSLTQITGMKTQKGQMESVLDSVKKLKNSKDAELIRTFYSSDTLYWLSKQVEITRQDMTDALLGNIFDFIDFVRMPILQTNGMCDKYALNELCMRAINNDNKITASPSVKGTLASIIIRDSTWKISSRPKHEIIQDFVRCYIYIHEKSEDFEYSIDFHTFLTVFNEDDSYSFTDYFMTYGLREEVDNFVHVLVDNLYNTQNRAFQVLRILNARQNATGEYAGEEPETIDFINDSQAISCNFMIIFSRIIHKVLMKIMRKDTSIVFNVATRDKFVMYLLWSIDEMLGSNRATLKVKDFTGFDATKTLLTLYELFTLCYPNADFRKSVINETRYLNFKNMRKMGDILYNNKKALLNQEYTNLYNAIHELEEAHKLVNDIDLDELPDEFLDPIMGTLIDDPVMLPECETIMNRDIIYRHVLAEKNNPFNRKELTIGELETFNSQEDTKKKIRDFNEKKAQCLLELSS